jgi:hypothetical protein
MFLEDGMIKSGSCPFGPECEMHREVINDLKVVYYRGRYRAATAWSKVGKASAAEKPLMTEVHNIGQDEAIERRRKTSPSLQPVA